MVQTTRALLTLLLAGMLCGLAGCGGGDDDSGATVPAAPTITAQPADTQLTQGTNAQFQVGATADGATLSYQWQRSNDGGSTWVAIADATTASLSLPAVSSADNGAKFRAVISSGEAQTISSAATLTVSALVLVPEITVQPAAQQVIEGLTASFSVTATGTALNYQWQRSSDGQTWADIADAHQPTLQLSLLAVGASGQLYRVILRNAVAAVTSDAAMLTVLPAPATPVFSTQPMSTSVTAPSPATFSVVVSGSPSPSLQWQRSIDMGASYVDAAGATSPSYTTGATSPAEHGTLLRLLAANSAGTTLSAPATLSVSAALAAPLIQQQPPNVTVAAGQTATWTVASHGNPQPGYQWQHSNDDGATFANINGATAASYSLVAAATDNGRRLRVVVSNSQGSVTSNAAALTVSAGASSLAGHAWTAGQQMEAGDGLMPGLVASQIDDQGRVLSLFAKQEGARIALFAVRGTPGAAGQAPSYGTPVVIDGAQPFDWRKGVSLAISPAGNAVAGWQILAPCGANTYNTSGNCTYWVVARYLAATDSWEAPATVGDMALLPTFEANINDAGDIAGVGSGWNRNSSGDLDTVAMAAYWRAHGQSTFSRRVFTSTDINDINIPTRLVLDASGNFVIAGLGRQGLVSSSDMVAFRGHVRSGVGAREVVDLRGADVSNVQAYGNAAGQVVLTWSQNNGSQASTYAASLDSPSGSWNVADLGLPPQTGGVSATLSSDGDFIRYSWTRCAVLRRTAGVWGSEAALPSGTCAGSPRYAVSRNGHFLAVQTLGTNTGRWLSYDTTLHSIVSPYTGSANGMGYVLGLAVLPTSELLLAPNGIGALISPDAYDVLPTLASPNGDSRGVTSLWGWSFK